MVPSVRSKTMSDEDSFKRGTVRSREQASPICACSEMLDTCTDSCHPEVQLSSVWCSINSCRAGLLSRYNGVRSLKNACVAHEIAHLENLEA